MTNYKLAKAYTEFIVLLGLFAFLPSAVWGQDTPSVPVDTTQSLRGEAPRVFLDCRRCDESYIRRQITFVNYVRDRQQADIHVLVTSQNAGGGGEQYNLTFIGRNQFDQMIYELTYNSLPTETRAEEREGLTRTLRIGLAPFVSQTPLGAQVDVTFEGIQQGGQVLPVDDPWDHWIFEIEAGGGFQSEASQSSYSFDGGLSADRVTETWKIGLELQTEYEEDNFERDSVVITSTSQRTSFEGELIRSLTRHWSVGAFLDVFSNTFNNMQLGAFLTPAVEYSVFPYAVSDRRELTVTYRIGPHYANYREITIFNKTNQLLVRHSLEVALDLQQPWGFVFTSLEGSNYFHDLSKNRLQFNSFLSIRLVEGLSLNINGEVAVVHDQLYLPRGGATLREILLRRRALATNYEFEMSIGFSYTFGSIYNNIVNTRL